MSKLHKKKDLSHHQINNTIQSSSRPFGEMTQAETQMSTPRSNGFKLSKIDMSPAPPPVQRYFNPIQPIGSSHSNSTKAKSISEVDRGNISLQKKSDKLIQKKVIQLDYELPLDTYTIGDLAEHNIREADAGLEFIGTLNQNAQQELQNLTETGPSQGIFQGMRNRSYHKKRQKIMEKIQAYDSIMSTILIHKGRFKKRRKTEGNQSIIDQQHQRIDQSQLEKKHGKYIGDYLVPMITERLKMKEKLVKKGINDAYLKQLDASEWRTLTKQINLYNKEKEADEVYTSKMTPVNSEFEATHYNKEHGVEKYGTTGQSAGSGKKSSPDIEQQKRTTNLWKTELRKGGADGETIFEGFRSGALAYTGSNKKITKKPQKRQEIARSKTYGLLQAILIDKLKKLTPQQRAEYYDNDDKSMNIDVVSSSLQTYSFFSGEGAHIDDQIAALDYYDGREETFEVHLTGDEHHQVKAKISTIAFNFAVNEFRPLGYLGGGLRQQNNFNEKATKKLGEAYDQYIETMETQMKSNVENREMTEHEVEQANTKISGDIEKVKKLWEQIKAAMFDRRLAYELPSMVGNLTFLIGRTAHFNCKSGKDRTGIDDSENKFLAHQIHTTGQVPEYQNELEDKDQENYQKLLIEGGNLDVQKVNTGVKGFVFYDKKLGIKLNKDVQQRFGKLVNLVKGLGKFTSA